MTYFRPFPFDLEQGPVTIRALRSLTGKHVERVTQALAATGEQWLIDPHDGCDGYLSLVVTRESDGMNFAITGRADRIEVDEMRRDDMHRVGYFDTIDEALLALSESLHRNRR